MSVLSKRIFFCRTACSWSKHVLTYQIGMNSIMLLKQSVREYFICRISKIQSKGEREKHTNICMRQNCQCICWFIVLCNACFLTTVHRYFLMLVFFHVYACVVCVDEWYDYCCFSFKKYCLKGWMEHTHCKSIRIFLFVQQNFFGEFYGLFGSGRWCYECTLNVSTVSSLFDQNKWNIYRNTRKFKLTHVQNQMNICRLF